MSTGKQFARLMGMVLCLGCLCSLSTASEHTQRKTKKPPLPPLPSGPTGPVQPIPLDSIAPVPPQVSYQNGLLTIVAPNSTLGDILRAVRKQTGAEIEVPTANDRVVTHLGPGAAREVMADLLNGSRFNYVLLGSDQDSNLLTRVVLVPKTGPENAIAANPQGASPPQPGMMQGANMQPQPQPDASGDMAEADTAEDSAEDNPDQSAADAEQAEQPAGSPEQPGVKTPQQMLQEMQQRQLQVQQQQQSQGQVPVPPPVRPPQEQ